MKVLIMMMIAVLLIGCAELSADTRTENLNRELAEVWGEGTLTGEAYRDGDTWFYQVGVNFNAVDEDEVEDVIFSIAGCIARATYDYTDVGYAVISSDAGKLVWDIVVLHQALDYINDNNPYGLDLVMNESLYIPE